MNENNENTGIFFSYEGRIGRKNHFINMVILILLYVGLTLIRPDGLTANTNFKFLNTILYFMIDLMKFLTVMSSFTLLYRRINDICINRTQKFCSIMRKIYTVIYVIPLFVYFCAPLVVDMFPAILNGIYMAGYLVAVPIMILTGIILSVIPQGKTKA